MSDHPDRTPPPAPACQPRVVLTPLRQAAPAEGGTLEVLLRVQAPDAPADPAARRAPLRVALVVDRSGSMSGEPLRAALACAEHIAGRLTPEDRVAILTYDSTVQVLAGLQPAGDRAHFARLLRGVQSGGCTALHAGWEAGAAQLGAAADASAGAALISRVILLSDGQANEGLTDAAEIARRCAEQAARGVTTTTVGLGRSFNEELMVGMARAGLGRHYYGQTAEDLLDGFDEELSLLEALCARALTVRLVVGPGVLVEVLSVEGADARAAIALQDVAYGAESWLLVRLHLAAQAAGPRLLLGANVQGATLDGGVLNLAAPLLELAVRPRTECEQLPTDPVVAARLTEVRVAQLAARVREQLGAGDRDAARRLLAEAEHFAREHPWVREKLAMLQRLLEEDAAMAAKELLYSAARLRLRNTGRDESVGSYADETHAADMPAFLRRKLAEGRGRRGSEQ